MSRFITFNKAVDQTPIMIDMDRVYSVIPITYVINGINTDCIRLQYGDLVVSVIGSLSDLINILENTNDDEVGSVTEDLMDDPFINHFQENFTLYDPSSVQTITVRCVLYEMPAGYSNSYNSNLDLRCHAVVDTQSSANAWSNLLGSITGWQIKSVGEYNYPALNKYYLVYRFHVIETIMGYSAFDTYANKTDNPCGLYKSYSEALSAIMSSGNVLNESRESAFQNHSWIYGIKEMTPLTTEIIF